MTSSKNVLKPVERAESENDELQELVDKLEDEVKAATSQMLQCKIDVDNMQEHFGQLA